LDARLNLLEQAVERQQRTLDVSSGRRHLDDQLPSGSVFAFC
jgi:hypothetical protein